MTKMEKVIGLLDSRHFWTFFAVLTVFVYFFGLNVPLLGPDEPRYAQVAREMYERGDWVTPTLGGFNWFEKPALLYWLQIVSYNLFGVSEFSARLGSAFFGLGTIAALWILGRRLATEYAESFSEDKSSQKIPVPSVAEDFANWLALIAATSLGLIVFARGASFDIILTFPITATMVAFYVFDSSDRANIIRRNRAKNPPATAGGTDVPASARNNAYFPLFAFYFFIGVALLAKGLVGIVFPFAIVALYYVLSRRFPSRVFLLSLVWGTALSVAVAAIWYLPMYLKHGWEFIDEFFIQHHFQRYTSNKYLHPQPFHFFFWVLPLMTLPWLPFFIAAIWRIIKSVFYHRGTEAQRKDRSADSQAQNHEVTPTPPLLHSSNPLLLYSLAWMLVPLVFFSFSGSKLPGYIMPALPPTVVLTTLYLVGFVGKKERRAYWIKALALATFVIVIGILAFILPRAADMDSVKGLLASADERGFRNEKLLGFITVSHNAEFYAQGRLIRDADGKQKRLINTGEVRAEVEKTETKSALVITPLEHLRHIVNSPELASEVISDNGEYALVHVTPR